MTTGGSVRRYHPGPVLRQSAVDIDAASRGIYDLLFSDGIGGNFIPDEAHTWLTRDMESPWAAAAAAKKKKGE